MPTITSINSPNILRDSRSVINANFSALNNGLILKTVITVGQATGADYVCDGTADDVQLQLAVDAAGDAGGGLILVRKATYNLIAAVLLRSNVTIMAEAGTLFRSSTSDHNSFKTTLSGTTQSFYSNIHLSNIKVESQKGSGIVINNTDGITLRDCEVYFSGTTTIRQGIFLQHCKNIKVNDNYLHDLTGNGISLTHCTNWRVLGNEVIGGPNADDLIDIDYDFLDTATLQSDDGLVVGNMLKSSGLGNGIRVENSNNISVTGNQVSDVSSINGAGILINATGTETMKNIVVVGNQVNDCTDRGIAVEKGASANINDVIVNANIVENCGSDGGSNIRGGIVISSPNVTCHGNRVKGTLKTGGDAGGIIIYKQSNISVHGNTIKNSVTGLRLWNGDGLQTYTDIDIKNNKMSSNTTDYAGENNALIQAGVNIEQPYTGTKAHGNITTAETFNVAHGDIHTATLTGNVTVTLTDGVGRNQTMTLILTQDATGSRLVTWPPNFKKAGGSLTLSTGAAAVDVIKMRWDGTNWREVSRALNLS